MKKMYITPEVEEIKVNAMNMLAQSDMNLNETETDTSQPGGQLGREEVKVFTILQMFFQDF